MCDLFVQICRKTERMKPRTFILHDDSVNTYGFRMLTAGANLEEFEKNPVMFYVHNDMELPIGRWENIRKEESRILADAVFDEDDDQAVKVMRKVDSNFIRMASISTWAPEEVSDAPELKLDGQTMPTIVKWTVREASIVPIGANHNALAMYDRATGSRIDLSDPAAVLQLMDKNTISHSKEDNMKRIKEILCLQDSATEEEVATAIKSVQTENENLRKENESLKAAEAEREKTQKEAQVAEAAALVDAAVKDGRIDAAGKEAYIALFDKDFDGAKKALAAIPARPSVTEQINQHSGAGGKQLSDLSGKSWDELDRAGQLQQLRDADPELFREKFKARFGVEPSKQ